MPRKSANRSKKALIFVASVAKFTVMKSANVYKRDRSKKPFEVKYWNEDGKRISISFTNKVEAEAFAKERNNEHKLPPLLQFTIEERMEFAKFRELAAEKNIPLNLAIRKAIGILKKMNTSEKIPFELLQKNYLNDCQKRKMRPSTQDYYKQHLTRFSKYIGSKTLINEIDGVKVQAYLLSISSRDHAKRVLSAFFQYAKDRGLIAQNIIKDISLPKSLGNREIPNILTPLQTQENLNAVADEYKAAFALMAFCGVRPEEICNDKYKPVLTWNDINFSGEKITVRADVAKTRTARIISDAPKNVWKWLDTYKNDKGNVFPRTYAFFRNARRAMPHKLTHDVFRHSFASYAYHYIGIEKAVEIMGQEGGFAVYKKHYKGIATASDSELYFSIVPIRPATS